MSNVFQNAPVEHSAIFRLALSYHLSLQPMFCLFLSGRFTQVLLYFRHALSYHLSLQPLFCLFLSGPLRKVLL